MTDGEHGALSHPEDRRLDELGDWVGRQLGARNLVLRVASADASFRRYFRVVHGGCSYIAMDAPPSHEDSRPFVDVARRLHAAGLNAPRVLHADLQSGYLLLSDLGTQDYLSSLDSDNADRLYAQALAALQTMQTRVDPTGLPDYDATLLDAEMRLFSDWFLDRHLQLEPDPGRTRILERACALLRDSALAQPRCFVHRDYHSRNLMCRPGHAVGILDFQDAVRGPLTYDLVSLLRDCYIDWPPSRIYAWMEGFRASSPQPSLSAVEFRRAFDWMGMQRHLKAIGIFARLYHRDHKPGYLGDIPRTLGYLKAVAADYPEFDELCGVLDTLVLPGAPPR